MDFANKLLELLAGNQPWWVWLGVIIIPFCMLLSFREFMCWFWKINKLVGRLERIERRLNGLQLGTSTEPIQKPSASVAKKHDPSAVARSSQKKATVEDYTL